MKDNESPPGGGAQGGHASHPSAALSPYPLTQPRHRGYASNTTTSSALEVLRTSVKVGPYVFGLTERELAAEQRRLRRAGWKIWELAARFSGLRLVRDGRAAP